MSKRKSTETLHEQQRTPKKPRWCASPFPIRSPSSTCSLRRQSSLTTTIAKTEPSPANHRTAEHLDHHHHEDQSVQESSPSSASLEASRPSLDDASAPFLDRLSSSPQSHVRLRGRPLASSRRFAFGSTVLEPAFEGCCSKHSHEEEDDWSQLSSLFNFGDDPHLASIFLPSPDLDCSDYPQWVCCACDRDNEGNSLWCTNKTCSHYTINCIDCFSY